MQSEKKTDRYETDKSDNDNLSVPRRTLNDHISSATDFERDPNKNPYGDEPLTEQEILDVAESVFIKISDSMKMKELSLEDVYGKKLSYKNYEGEKIQILSPDDFIDSFKQLDMGDLDELEIECLLRVLLKPEIDDNIQFNDLVMILENFGVSE